MAEKINKKNITSKTWILTIGVVLNEEMEQEYAERRIDEMLENLYECGDSIRLVEKMEIQQGNIKIETSKE